MKIGVAKADIVHLVDQLRRRRLVDRERHQGLLAVARSRDGHVRDVEAARAEQRPDTADHAGDVVVAEEHHVRRELDVDPEAVGAREEEPPSGPIVVPETSTSSPPSGVTRTSTTFM